MPTKRSRYHPADASDRQWRMLLAFALARADEFECALPYRYLAQDLSSLPLWPKELAAFGAQLVDRHVSLIRWDISHDYPTQFARFRLSPELSSWLASVPSLERWSWRLGLPEDPTLLVAGQPLLATESRDGRIAVYADPLDLDSLNGVGIRLLEPLGVRAEPWPTP